MCNRVAYLRFDLRVAVFPEHRARHTEGQTVDTALDSARHVVRGLAAGRGIGGVRALHRLVNDRSVGRVAGQRTRAVEALAQWIDAGAAHPSHRRLQAGDPAHARRDPDRSAGIGAQSHRRHSRRHRDAGARARPARQMRLGMPRIVRGSLIGVDAGAAVRKLHRDRFAEQHHPGSRQPTDDGAVGGRHVVGEEAGARGRRQARHVVQVLGRVRDAVQRTEVDARPELHVRGPCLCQRPFPTSDRKRTEARIERVDPIEEVLRDRCRRQLAGTDRPSQLDDGPIVDGGLHLASSGGVAAGQCIVRRLAEATYPDIQRMESPVSVDGSRR